MKTLKIVEAIISSIICMNPHANNAIAINTSGAVNKVNNIPMIASTINVIV
jgi:hypothetical protein